MAYAKTRSGSGFIALSATRQRYAATNDEFKYKIKVAVAIKDKRYGRDYADTENIDQKLGRLSMFKICDAGR